MQNLRDLYRQIRSNAFNNYEKNTVNNIHLAYIEANNEYQKCLSQDNYTNLQEILFYIQKFLEVQNVYKSQVGNKVKIQQSAKEILKEKLPPSLTMQPIKQVNQDETNNKKSILHDSNTHYIVKSTLDIFFKNKQNLIQNSKIGFKSVIQGMPKTGKKHEIKYSNYVPSKVNQEQTKNLNGQIHYLKQKLKERQNQKQYEDKRTFCLLQELKKVYDQRINELHNQIETFTEMNDKLKSVKSAKTFSSPLIIYQRKKTQIEGKYIISFLSNDIGKISQQNMYQNIKSHLNYVEAPQKSEKSMKIYFNESLVKEFRNKQRKYSDASRKGRYKNQGQYQNKNSKASSRFNNLDLNKDNFILDNLLGPQSNKYIKKTQKLCYKPQYASQQNSVIESFQRSNQKMMADETSMISNKSKISFFKETKVLYRCNQFQISVKRIMVADDSLKIVLFVNNKENIEKRVKIQYKYSFDYYELNIVNKLEYLSARKQGRQQIQVKLINHSNIQSLIQVLLKVDKQQIHFLAPAMFIKFTSKSPSVIDKKIYEKCMVSPIYQFSNLASAKQILPFEIQSEQEQFMGKIYGISKYHEGYIFLRWKKGKVQIQTISAWKLFLGYLLTKDY